MLAELVRKKGSAVPNCRAATCRARARRRSARRPAGEGELGTAGAKRWPGCRSGPRRSRRSWRTSRPTRGLPPVTPADLPPAGAGGTARRRCCSSATGVARPRLLTDVRAPELRRAAVAALGDPDLVYLDLKAETERHGRVLHARGADLARARRRLAAGGLLAGAARPGASCGSRPRSPAPCWSRSPCSTSGDSADPVPPGGLATDDRRQHRLRLFLTSGCRRCRRHARTLGTVVNCNATTLLTFGLLAFCQNPVLQGIGVTVASGVLAASSSPSACRAAARRERLTCCRSPSPPHRRQRHRRGVDATMRPRGARGGLRPYDFEPVVSDLDRPRRGRRGRPPAGGAGAVRLPQQPPGPDGARGRRLRRGGARGGRALRAGAHRGGARHQHLRHPELRGCLPAPRSGEGALPADFDYEHTHDLFSLARFVRAALGLHGPASVISTACSSAAKAFGEAAS